MFAQPPIMRRPSVPKKLVHLAGVVLAVPILLLDRWVVLAGCLLAIVGAWLLIRFVAYGLIGVCLLLLVSGTTVAAGGWLVLIVGDGLAGVAGLLWGRRRLPWNSRKSVVGSLAFAAGTFACLWPCLLLVTGLPAAPAGLLAAATALAAAAMESLAVRLNDNLTVVVVAGVVLWLGFALIGGLA